MARPFLLTLVALCVALPTASAVDTSATIRNAPPEILSWQDSLEGNIYRYHIAATDQNGIEDLRAITLRFLDLDETPLSVIEDDSGQADGRRAIHWNGSVAVSGNPLVITLTLRDHAGGETAETRTVVGELVPAATAGPTAPPLAPMIGSLGIVGVALGARALRRP